MERGYVICGTNDEFPGFSEEVYDNEDGTVWCIEGNTSSKKSGSQRNGGEVCKQLRAYKKNKAGVLISIVGFGRPAFGAPVKKAAATKAAPVKKAAIKRSF